LALRLKDVLHLAGSDLKAWTSGGYKLSTKFSLDAFDRHVRGDETFAIQCVTRVRKLALFVAIDVDAEFEVGVLPLVRELFAQIGGDELLTASFTTDGSEFGRGKVIVTFAQPIPQHDARAFAAHVEHRIRSSEIGRILEQRQLDAFPKWQSGGDVRVLGRNAKRSGPMESAFTMDGELSPLLEHLRPLTLEAFTNLRIEIEIPPFVRRLLDDPWVRTETTATHYGRMVRFAAEASRLYGDARGRSVYDRWLETVRFNSPELAMPSLKTRDKRNVLDTGRESAWRKGSTASPTWVPLGVAGLKPATRRLYLALVGFVERNGLQPHAFAVDYVVIAQLVAIKNKSRAYRTVVKAEKAGLLVRHDRGRPLVRGARGIATLYGLVGRGETPASVLAAGAERREPQRRNAAGRLQR